MQLEKTINEEYKIWKKNAPFLYDTVVTHALEWPSLTVQWLPDVERGEGRECTVQRLLLGTHTSENEPNFLQIATVQMPAPGAAVDAARFDEERGEWGGFGGAGSSACRVTVVQRIPHEGEVNRARHMPQNACVLASKTAGGDVLIFDYTKHPSQPAPGAPCAPDLRLVGQQGEGYGLAWSPLQQGHVLAASEDRTVGYWDIRAAARDHRQLAPLALFRGHTGVVEDVAWHAHTPALLASVADDRQLLVWDARAPGDAPVQAVPGAHRHEINAVAFAPGHAHLLATGAADRAEGIRGPRVSPPAPRPAADPRPSRRRR